MPQIPGTIGGEEYPIAVDENGNLLWTTERVAEERDEVWENWSLGMGETEKETGEGYYFSEGWDGSVKNVLKLSPHFIADNNTALTTATGYFLEEEGAATTLTFDAASSGSGAVSLLVPLTVSHTVAAQDDRLLIVSIHMNKAGSNDIWGVTYAGQGCTLLAFKQDTSNNIKVAIFFLLNPPTGANNIVANFNVSANAVVGGLSFFNVNQDTPFDAGQSEAGSGTSTARTTGNVSTDEAAVFVTIDATGRTNAYDDANATKRYDADQTTIAGMGGEEDPADGTTTISWSGAAVNFVVININVKPATALFTFVIDDTKIYKYQYDADTLTLIATSTITSGVGGRPTKFLGVHYTPMGSGADSVRLTDVGVPTWTTSGFKADHLVSYQKGVDPTMVKSGFNAAGTEAEGQLGSVTTAPTSESFSDFGKAGDTSTKVTDLVAAGGQLYAMKEDGVFEFGLEGESRRVAFTGEAGKVDSDNGKGSFAFGDDTIVYMGDQMWRYRIGQGALPVGLDSLRGFRNVASTQLAPPIDGKPRSGVVAGEYWYVLQNEGERSLLLQMRQRREGDPPGHEMLIHGVLELPLCKGIWKDSRNNLWLKGATTVAADRDIRVIQLNKDGSLEVEKRKGQASATHIFTLDERGWDRPFEIKQFRAFHIETSGDWDSTTSLTTHIFRDDNDIVQIGSAITTAATTINNWTIGTSDQGYRLRPQLQLATNSSYKPLVADAGVLRFKVVARFPEIIRIVVNAEEMALDAKGLEPFEAEQNLRRLQQQGDITFRRPGDFDDPATGTDLVTDRTFKGEIESVTDTMYRTAGGHYAHGFSLRVRRWVTV